MSKERDSYERFLSGMMSSFDFRRETAKRWNKYVREFRKRRENSPIAPQNPREKVVK